MRKDKEGIEELYGRLKAAWRSRFCGEPRYVTAPGRINIIGEHTDHNGGSALPAAIDRCLMLAAKPVGNGPSRIYSADMDSWLEFDVLSILPEITGTWQRYVIGVARQLIVSGCRPCNIHAAFAGNIPPGGGMASSAALENAFVFAWNELSGCRLSRSEMVRVSQQAEHISAGVRCGIMDQYAGMFGRKGYALLLDCREQRSTEVRIHMNNAEWVVVDTGVRHQHMDSGYNARRRECEKGLALLRERWPFLRTLSDVSKDMLREAAGWLPGEILDRCTYVVRENERVRAMMETLKTGDPEGVGGILLEGHDDLRSRYNSSCPEADWLVEAASASPYVYGGRLMGGGFGGCTLHLVHSGQALNAFGGAMQGSYRRTFGKELRIFHVTTSDGTGWYSGQGSPRRQSN